MNYRAGGDAQILAGKQRAFLHRWRRIKFQTFEPIFLPWGVPVNEILANVLSSRKPRARDVAGVR